MKKLSKTLLAVAAVSVVSAAMAASAMAMDARYVDPETDPEGVGYVELTNVEANGKSQTLLIYKSEDGEGTFNTVDYTTDDIEGINQEDGDNTTPGSVQGNVPVGDLAEGTYQVRVAGSEGTMQFASFEVTSGGGEVDTMIVYMGDVTGEGTADMRDAAAVASATVGQTTADTAKVGNRHRVVSGLDGVDILVIGDVTNEGTADMRDAAAVASATVGQTTTDTTNVYTQVTIETAEITE